MKKLLLLISAATLLCLAGCKAEEPAVMARFVPERLDDFIFENDLIAGRIYGQALESCGKGQITSPGIDVWVKTPGALVANQRYVDELQNGKSYHIDWGNGKDCYKVGCSLGAGASAPIVDGALCLPATNFRSWEILEQQPNKVVFRVSYPEWQIAGGVLVSLDKTFTVVPGTYFVKCQDCYKFEGTEQLTVAAGINRHIDQEIMVSEKVLDDRCMLWEHASDQSVEPEDGLLGIAVVMPEADSTGYTADMKHAICCKTVLSGQELTYYFGSCWTKGNVKSDAEWYRIAENE